MLELSGKVIVQNKDPHIIHDRTLSMDYSSRRSMSSMEDEQLLEEAMQAHKEGKIEDALSKYRETIENDCTDKRAYANLAAILRSKGEAKDAAKVANKGLSVCGQNSPILLNTLGNSLRDLGRFVEAINVYRRAIKHAPHYMDPKYGANLEWMLTNDVGEEGEILC